MTDYIKRADAIDACCRGWNNTIEDCIRNIKEIPSAWYRGMECAQDIISALPSAETVHIETYRELYEKYVELKHASADAVQGEWKKVEEQPYFRKHYDTVCCSVCRKKGNRKWNYCPNCGARMTPYKGGEEE